MLKRGTKVTLYSPSLGSSREFESSHAAALLALVEGDKKPTWVLPEGSKYIYENGDIKQRPGKRATGKK